LAHNKNQQLLSRNRKLEYLFDGPDEKRIAVVMPESAGDLLMINSLLTNFKKLYQEYNIYLITKPEFYPMVDDHPAIYQLIPYHQEFDNILMLEGRADFNGYFDMAFLPFIETQRILGATHNGIDKDGLGVLNDLNNNYDPYLQTR
jgi:hypothetical protein